VAAVAQHGRHDVVSVGEDRRRHVDGLTDGPLDREAAAVDLRLDALDDDAAAECLGNCGLRIADCGATGTSLAIG